MAVARIDKVITMVNGDAVTEALRVRGIHLRRTAVGAAGIVSMREGTATTALFSADLIGTGATTAVDGYYLDFGDDGFDFEGGLALLGTDSAATIFLA